MNIAVINARVDQALADNRRGERLIVQMALAIFVVGLFILLFAYWLKNPYVASGSVLTQGFLVFPIKEIRKLRRDNLILQTFPTLITTLPQQRAAIELSNLLKYLLREGAK